MTSHRDLSILICGDICPTDDTRALFDQGDATALFGDLTGKIKSADLAIANLECVLSDTAAPAEKIGPVLTGKPRDAALLAAAGFDLLGCANNHIQDCGAQGVIDTLTACMNAGLRTTGAAASIERAVDPAIFDIDGWTVGVMAVAEQEFNASGPDLAGAHIFEPLEDLDRLRNLKARCDFIIVLYHGGIEYYAYPSPGLQKTCRALIRNGADVVLCQHSHVIGSYESYLDGHILYGQGNTTFGYRAGNIGWNTGLAVEIKLISQKKKKFELKFHPIGCSSDGRIDFLSSECSRICVDALDDRSKKMRDPNFVVKAWLEFCNISSRQHLPFALGWGIWLIRANRVLKGRLVRWLYSRRRIKVILNVLRCTSHREVILTSLLRILERKG